MHVVCRASDSQELVFGFAIFNFSAGVERNAPFHATPQEAFVAPPNPPPPPKKEPLAHVQFCTSIGSVKKKCKGAEARGPPPPKVANMACYLPEEHKAYCHRGKTKPALIILGCLGDIFSRIVPS